MARTLQQENLGDKANVRLLLRDHLQPKLSTESMASRMRKTKTQMQKLLRMGFLLPEKDVRYRQLYLDKPLPRILKPEQSHDRKADRVIIVARIPILAGIPRQVRANLQAPNWAPLPILLGKPS